MKPKCKNCRGLYQEKNEILDNGVCENCKPQVDYQEQIAITDRWEEEQNIEEYFYPFQFTEDFSE